MPDLFLSYAHVDKHWVDAFAPLLEQRVNQHVGRSKPDRLWKDNRLTGNEAFSPEIHTQLNTARCLIACLSPGYLASEWCQRELHTFSQRTDIPAGSMFCIELDEVSLDSRPVVLGPILGYRFWRQDHLSKRTYPLQPDTSDYENILTDLSKDIATKLLQQNAPPITQSFPQPPAGQSAQNPSLHAPPIAPELATRRDRLKTLLNRLHEQYELENREEERMRMERVIADKQKLLDQVLAEINNR
ncbi:MAG: toll/interleukin-1 receptor domain-containing protein [Thiolinea sp.]